jgi:hypothetical protein
VKVRTLCEIETARGTIPAGRIIEVSPTLMQRLEGMVGLLTDGRDLITYCPACDCWCSARLPEHVNPSPCRECGKEEP